MATTGAIIGAVGSILGGLLSSAKGPQMGAGGPGGRGPTTPYSPTAQASGMRLSDLLALTQPAGGLAPMGGTPGPGQDEGLRLADLLRELQAGG